MNKAQLLIAWVAGLAICAVLYFTPKIATYQGGLVLRTPTLAYAAPLVNWSLVISLSVMILIIAGLLICSLKK